MNFQYRVEIVDENMEISKGIYKLSLSGKFKGVPGQFYMLKTYGLNPLLPRPISIHDIHENKISFLYSVVGEGTKFLSQLRKGEQLQILGPLGKGFNVENIKGKAAIISGGIGIAPMLYLSKNLKVSTLHLYAGFRDEVYGIDDMKKYTDKIYLTTENGNTGVKGYITEIFNPSSYDIVLCCGPEKMMMKTVKLCKEYNVPIFVSMEKHMACGIGACLVCTCKTKNGNRRTCKDGPVFLGEDVIWDA
ncbi:dihydroorotate dehydrogenase electron transfer subunit [Fonticella tunisiensis]|uniref:Dihydroorotate dehydrogenase B (NAD(+)), electron transfer subunit n=1 Tax=Fonticella tunisiensis TaxID=1096341 RepID=A0A4R7KVT5_9CLOT|nr:dihydroorotate dehydrogenase electron transfer subunit [Fonticella tunisiensis]TDT62829.1 dihydroorotate dehydrogenase electron transfer subunit [Fonticella tunisiensis]